MNFLPLDIFRHAEVPRNFNATYRCYSVSMIPGQERHDLEKGGKIILPPSALDTLTRLHIQYPMLFKLTNPKTNKLTHCGVLEFVADEGRVYVPYWMMTNLLLEQGDMVSIENISLEVAEFAKFQPQSVDFLDISNPKAVLENELRNFACLTTGDVIAINYNSKIYELLVLKTEPRNAVSIIECDMNVDFAPPVGYQEPRQKKPEPEEEPMAIDAEEYIDASKFRVFSGQGNRLDGKTKNTEMTTPTLQPHEIKRGIPNYEYKKNKITFIRSSRPANGGSSQEKEPDTSNFTAFSGEGYSLRKKQNKRT